MNWLTQTTLGGYTIFDKTSIVARDDPSFKNLWSKTLLDADRLFEWENDVEDFDDVSLSPAIDADRLAYYCNNTKSITMMTRCAGKFARLVELKRGCPRVGKNKRSTWASIIKNKLQSEIDDRDDESKRTDQRTVEAILLHVSKIQIDEALIDWT